MSTPSQSTPIKDVRDKRVAVVGLGASGLAATQLLVRKGALVTVHDASASAELEVRAEVARQAGAEVELGKIDTTALVESDLVIVSPGVPDNAALQAALAAAVPVRSEIELASWYLSGTIVAVTGTNGKSTVTAWLGDMCQRTARPTFVGGNLGRPLSEAVYSPANTPGGLLVVELSSFQLERIEHFRAQIAVLLNLSEDHLDRYQTYADYVAAKGHLFLTQTRADTALIPDGDAACEALAQAGPATRQTFGGACGVVRVAGDALVNGGSPLNVPLSELGLRGRHNAQNACAAALAARLAGVPTELVADSLRAFRGLPHRLQHVARIDEVDYIDDSKATNVHAAVAAVDGLGQGRPQIVLIAGGKDKGGRFEDLASALAQHGRAAVLIGEATARLESAFQSAAGQVPRVRAGSMAQAVRAAQACAHPGDIVLLAPACSSFDMFRSYLERGDVFQEEVARLDASRSHGGSDGTS